MKRQVEFFAADTIAWREAQQPGTEEKVLSRDADDPAERIRGREITLGAGEHGLALAVDADEILQVLDASVADISDLEPAT